MFCTAMPMASAKAPERAAGSPLRAATANVRPRLIPSGMLCSVTALTSSVGRCMPHMGPSGSLLSQC